MIVGQFIYFVVRAKWVTYTTMLVLALQLYYSALHYGKSCEIQIYAITNPYKTKIIFVKAYTKSEINQVI